MASPKLFVDDLPVNIASATITTVSPTLANQGTPATADSDSWIVHNANQDAAFVAPASTAAPALGAVVLGKTNDGTPAYRPVPLGAGARTVIVEGYAGGTAVPVSGTVTATVASTTANQGNPVASDSDSWAVHLISGSSINQGSPVAADSDSWAVHLVSSSATANQGSPVAADSDSWAVHLVSSTVGRAATEVTPTAQTTTSDELIVTGSTLDTLNNYSASYTIQNTGAESIDWRVMAGNVAGMADKVQVQASATVLAAGVSSYSVAGAPYRYYAVYVTDTVGGSHGQATVHGITKG